MQHKYNAQTILNPNWSIDIWHCIAYSSIYPPRQKLLTVKEERPSCREALWIHFTLAFYFFLHSVIEWLPLSPEASWKHLTWVFSLFFSSCLPPIPSPPGPPDTGIFLAPSASPPTPHWSAALVGRTGAVCLFWVQGATVTGPVTGRARMSEHWSLHHGYTYRTGSSDCCPDYFSHCEGLSDHPGTGEGTILLRLPQYYEQIGPEPATIHRPPQDDYYEYEDHYYDQAVSDCPHGVLDVKGEQAPYCSLIVIF